MSTYNVSTVERFVRNYLTIRNVIEGHPPQTGDDNAFVVERKGFKRERPLGQGAKDANPWPFMEPTHAKPPRDGKARARAREELHAMCLDFERATWIITEDDRRLIYAYHLFKTHTLEELVKEHNMENVKTAFARVKRATERLTKAMEYSARDG